MLLLPVTLRRRQTKRAHGAQYTHLHVLYRHVHYRAARESDGERVYSGKKTNTVKFLSHIILYIYIHTRARGQRGREHIIIYAREIRKNSIDSRYRIRWCARWPVKNITKKKKTAVYIMIPPPPPPPRCKYAHKICTCRRRIRAEVFYILSGTNRFGRLQVSAAVRFCASNSVNLQSAYVISSKLSAQLVCCCCVHIK